MTSGFISENVSLEVLSQPPRVLPNLAVLFTINLSPGGISHPAFGFFFGNHQTLEKGKYSVNPENLNIELFSVTCTFITKSFLFS